MVLIVFLSSRISPFTSTVIFFNRSPLATAVVTAAMLRTWPVRLLAIRFTLSVRSFQRSEERRAGTGRRCRRSAPASSATRVTAGPSLGAHLARHARLLRGERPQLIHHGVDRVLELEQLALHVHRDLLGEVAVGHRGGHGGDVAYLAGEVAGHQVHVVGEVLP